MVHEIIFKLIHNNESAFKKFCENINYIKYKRKPTISMKYSFIGHFYYEKETFNITTYDSNVVIFKQSGPNEDIIVFERFSHKTLIEREPIDIKHFGSFMVRLAVIKPWKEVTNRLMYEYVL